MSITILFFFGCGKKINRPYHFIGTWEWEYTIVYIQDGNKLLEDTIYPNQIEKNIDFSAQVEVKKNGSVLLYKNNNLLHRIAGKDMKGAIHSDYNSSYVYVHQRKTDSGNGFYLRKRNDKMEVIGFPITSGLYHSHEFPVVVLQERLTNYNIPNYSVFKKTSK